jgi:hypothetical protein
LELAVSQEVYEYLEELDEMIGQPEVMYWINIWATLQLERQKPENFLKNTHGVSLQINFISMSYFHNISILYDHGWNFP